MEKVEVVKKLIRSHNYCDIEKIYIRCLEFGIHVNKTALSRFSQKLSLLDKVNKPIDRQKEEQVAASVIDVPARQATPRQVELSEQHENDFIVERSVAVNVKAESDNIKSVVDIARPVEIQQPETLKTEGTIGFSEAKRREAEITFELGALKIKEHALLEELNKLSKIIDETH
jgi:hypothetical protein